MTEKVDKVHVQYEFAMLFHAVNNMKTGIHDGIVFNVYNIVGFNCAANLIDYLGTLQEIPHDIEVLRGRIAIQVRTLTNQRTNQYASKLKDKDLFHIFEYIFNNINVIGLDDINEDTSFQGIGSLREYFGANKKEK